MIAYCTHCWLEVSSEAKACPGCKANLTLDNRTYEEKLIGALAHPLPEARVRICWLIGETHLRQATPDLMRLAVDDPDLFVRKAALEGLGALRDPRSASLLRTISESENRFLAAVARKSLNAIAQEQVSCADGTEAWSETFRSCLTLEAEGIFTGERAKQIARFGTLAMKCVEPIPWWPEEVCERVEKIIWRSYFLGKGGGQWHEFTAFDNRGQVLGVHRMDGF